MASSQIWLKYDSDYRAEYMAIVADWFRRGKSGAIAGAGGVGKSNFLGFLCYYPGSLKSYLSDMFPKIVIVPVDLNGLPAFDISTFYRVLLRSCIEMLERFDDDIQAELLHIYEEIRATNDPFLAQSGFRKLLFALNAKEMRLILVFDSFDSLAADFPRVITNNLRSLYNTFEHILIFIFGMRNRPRYSLNQEVLGELYKVLDSNICWLGPMNKRDVKRTIARELGVLPEQVASHLVDEIYTLGGGFPSLTKHITNWYRMHPNVPVEKRIEGLLQQPNLTFRLGELWNGLTLVEQLAAYHIHQGGKKKWQLNELVVEALLQKGIARNVGEQWEIGSQLFRAYLETMPVPTFGEIRFDPASGFFYQGERVIENLTPLEANILKYLIAAPYKRFTYTQIAEAWAIEEHYEGISTGAISKHVSNLRQKIEPFPGEPRYVINWRGTPEGGYYFVPEGAPL